MKHTALFVLSFASSFAATSDSALTLDPVYTARVVSKFASSIEIQVGVACCRAGMLYQTDAPPWLYACAGSPGSFVARRFMARSAPRGTLAANASFAGGVCGSHT